VKGTVRTLTRRIAKRANGLFTIPPAVSRPFAYIGSRLPQGWGDLVRQVVLFLVAYQAYQLVRGIADGRAAVAFQNGDSVIQLERSLGAFFEPGFQQALLDHQRWLVDFANFMYINSHYVITASFLAWLYLYRNEHFYFVRNMFMVSMVIALIGYAAFPTAPPRFYPEWGFTDTVAVFTGVEQDSKAVSLLVNPFAAVPSMHIAFALMIAVPGAALSRTAAARALWSVYPLMVLFVVVATANHYWFDAAAGAAVACLAALGARQLARVRPEAWSWREAPEQAVA
jgi:PAP2 superfamily